MHYRPQPNIPNPTDSDASHRRSGPGVTGLIMVIVALGLAIFAAWAVVVERIGVML